MTHGPEAATYSPVGDLPRRSALAIGLAATALLAAPAARAAGPASLEGRLRAIITSPDAPGPAPVVRRIELTETRAVIGLELPHAVSLSDVPPSVENRFETAVGALAALRPSVAEVQLLLAHPGEPLRPPKPLRPRLERPAPPPRLESVRSDPARFPMGQALAGRTVAISPGHGYIYYDSLGRYSTQRGNIKWDGCGSCDGIVEDFGTHQLAVRYLIPLLEGAGARVVLVRERDYSPEGTIVDDAEAGYAETGGAWSDGSSPGGHGDDYRVSNDPAASVEWTLTAPQAGLQMLSLWFVSGSNRHGDAWVEVEAGATSQAFLLDMTSHGRRWAPVNLLHLAEGAEVKVRLRAPTNPEADRFLIADAARLGAGEHSSGHAWWSMGASVYAGYQDAPAEVQSFGDVSIRPAYAEFYGAEAYLSLHSNASGQPNSTAAGTSSYRYNCGSFPDHSSDPPASSCDDPAGSDRLQAEVHAAMVDQLKADWDPNWRDRGPKVANFGEVRNLDGIPGVLMESAFHDNVTLPSGSDLRMTDNQALHDPRWRRAAAWGLYKGLSRFLAPDAPLVAPAPEALAVRRIDEQAVEVAFSEVPGALGYRVYASAGDGPFDLGRLVEASPARIEGLPTGVVTVRVATVNAAGEGPPSGLVAARTSRRPAQALLVDAFTREDAWVQEWDNRHDTARVHGLALAGVEYAFDGANEAALEAGLAGVDGYEALIFALGRESTADEILTPSLRAAVRAAAEAGAAVFFAGTEIGWALDARGDDAGRAFLADVFGAVYAADDAESDRVRAASGGWLEGAVDAALADGASGLTETHFPDVFTAGPDGVPELTYANGADLAGVRRGKNLLLGIALDNVVGADARAALLGTWLSTAVELAPEDVTPPVDAGVPGPDAGPAPDAGDVDGGVADAGVGDSDGPGIRLRPTAAVPIRGGCRGSTDAAPYSGFVLLLVTLLGARRRRRSSIDNPRGTC